MSSSVFSPAPSENRSVSETNIGCIPNFQSSIQKSSFQILSDMLGVVKRITELSPGGLPLALERIGNQTPELSELGRLLATAAIPEEARKLSSTSEVLGLAAARQASLTDSLQETKKIQKLDKKRKSLTIQSKEFDGAIRQFALRIGDAHNHLQKTLDEYKEYQPLLKKWRSENGISEDVKSESKPASKRPGLLHPEFSETFPVNISELISYSQRISYTTFAPPLYAQGGPLIGAMPPAPQDEQTRGCLLYQISEKDVGMSRPESDRDEKLPDSNEPKAGASEKPLLAKLASSSEVPGFEGLNLPPPPAGWKPGDPIDFLKHLPAPPAGWKPGDPVSLPPKEPAADMAAKKPTTSAPPQNIIQVPYVSLDLNPELDDSDSESSGSEESSDED